MAVQQCSYKATGVCSGPGCPLGVPFVGDDDQPTPDEKIVCSWQKRIVKAFFAEKEDEDGNQS